MSENASSEGGERRRTAWPRVAEGIQLVGIACFLFLNTSGHLPWSFWLDAISLWPLLVASLGVHIAFEKSRAPWLVLLGPVFVLGGLVWLASGARPSLPEGPWQVEVATRPAGVESVEFTANLAAARLHLATANDVPAGRLVDGRALHGKGGVRLVVETDGSLARVRLEGGEHRGIVFLPRPRDFWDLRLPRELPVSVHVRGAGVGARLDLTAADFRGARAEGVFIGLDARLPAPRRDTEITIDGVFNSVTLHVPEGTPVRVHGQGLPFNAIDHGISGVPGRPGYDIRVKGIFSAVEALVDPGISPAPPEPASRETVDKPPLR